MRHLRRDHGVQLKGNKIAGEINLTINGEYVTKGWQERT